MDALEALEQMSATEELTEAWDAEAERAAEESDAAQAPAAGPELVIKRIFDAPIGEVFEAWRDPARVAAWFGPSELSLKVRELDARPGGTLRMEGRCEAGAPVRIEARYSEVVAPDWIVYADACFVDDALICETLATVVFHEVEATSGRSATRLTLHCEPVQGFDAFARRRWSEGWETSFQRLEAYLQREAVPCT